MKIGIVTIFYNNYNYGANLQAFALNRICNNFGVETKTIVYCDCGRLHALLSNLKQSLIGLFHWNFTTRKMCIKKFQRLIPKTKKYYLNTIKKANNQFDTFIVGSDQVWNPNYLNTFYDLSFVNDDNAKVSYAASLGKLSFSKKDEERYSGFLADYSLISVREEAAQKLLTRLVNKNIELVLDPTLLLCSEEWLSICSPRRVVEDYLFCYFLNDNELHRKLAIEFAAIKHLKIVTIPDLSYSYRECDKGFGDFRLYNVGPSDFLSLIKHSSFVFTDSFHATVFSLIFNKQFIVFDDFKSSTGSRIETLSSLFHTSERYINNLDDANIENIIKLDNIDYTDLFDDYLLLREQSIVFLKKALGLKHD